MGDIYIYYDGFVVFWDDIINIFIFNKYIFIDIILIYMFKYNIYIFKSKYYVYLGNK